MKMNLKWNNGELNLNLDEFFPAKPKKMKELLEILKICDDSKYKIKEVITYILNKMKEFENNDEYIKGWNFKENKNKLKELKNKTRDHKIKYKIQKLQEDYLKWNLYLNNLTSLGVKDNRGCIDWKKFIKEKMED